jgi:hypothetical protein
MLRVPDVRATIIWYTSIGFALLSQNEDDGIITWASRSFDNGEIMLNTGGPPASAHRRDVDLYICTDSLDSLHRQLKDRVDIVEDIHITFYGMREFIIRDCNGFWVTFAQPSAS